MSQFDVHWFENDRGGGTLEPSCESTYGRLTQYIRYRLHPCPFQDIAPFGRNVVYVETVIPHHFIELDKIINIIGNSMQTITLINQKGRGGKTAYKRLTNTTNYFFLKKGVIYKFSVR